VALTNVTLEKSGLAYAGICTVSRLTDNVDRWVSPTTEAPVADISSIAGGRE